MKKIILLIIVAVVSVSLSSYAGPLKKIKKDLKVALSPSTINLVEKDGQVDVVFKISVPANYVQSKHQYMFTPVLTDYTNIMPLTSVIIDGKKYAEMSAKKGHSREMQQKLESAPDMSNAIMLTASKNARIIDYEYTVPFEPWMENAHLVCIQRFNSKKSTVLIGESIYGKGVKITPCPKVIEAIAIVNNIEGIAKINFPVSSSKIDLNLSNNRSEISKMENIINSIIDIESNIIDSIVVTASSSPEGSFLYNEKLAMSRSKSVKSYLVNKLNIKLSSNDIIKTKCIAENWTGLENLVLASAVPNKTNIIRTLSIRNLVQRERAMMALPEYSYIKRNLLPSLRFVKYQIYYHTVSIAIIEAEEVPVVNNQPQQPQHHSYNMNNKMIVETKMRDNHYYRYHRDEWKNNMY